MSWRGARIGELLRKSGDLTSEQVDSILREQQLSGRPFGDLAERMFGVGREATQRAWVKQYMGMGTLVDLDGESIDPGVLGVLTRRQAWQMMLLPLRREEGGLVVATSPERLPRAITFAWQRLQGPIYVLIADRKQLAQYLGKHYPWPAMDAAQKRG